ncbi:MAG: hypothetical protein CMJ33_04110 [Phycisphaerae bacterium]|nr:hypothetical protein [Phycisphaerae bacterium]
MSPAQPSRRRERPTLPIPHLLVLFGALLASPPAHADDVPDPASERSILIESVRLLRSDGETLIASEPTDLIVRDGRVHEVGDDLGGKVAPTTLRLRRPDRWLMPSPVAVIDAPAEELIRFDDLIHAGLMGFGELMVGAAPEHLEIVRKRALLESEALPIITTRVSKSVPDHALSFDRIDDLSLSGTVFSKQDDLLARSVRRPDDPFAPGAPAHFLLLSEDPRIDPGAVGRSDAVLVGGEAVFKSERVVRLDEHDRYDPGRFDPPEETPAVRDFDQSIFEVVIAGIPRELIRLRIEDTEEPTGLKVEIEGVTSSPIERSWSTNLTWPVGSVVHRAVIQRHVFELESTHTVDGGRLEIIRNGMPLPESPLDLESGDRYLPDTLLILLDALRNPTEGATRRVVEVDFYGGPVAAYWAVRRPLVPVALSNEATPLGLTTTEMLHLAGPEGKHLMTCPPLESQSSSIWVALDGRKRLLWALHRSPAGLTEWRRRPESSSRP